MVRIAGSLGSQPLQVGQEPQVSRPKLAVFFGALSMASALGAIVAYFAMGLSLPPVVGLAMLAIFAFFVMKECKPKPASKEKGLPRPDEVLSGVRQRQHNEHRVSHPYATGNVVEPVVSQEPEQPKNPAAAARRATELMNHPNISSSVEVDHVLGVVEEIIQNCEQALDLAGEPLDAQRVIRAEVKAVRRDLLGCVGGRTVQGCSAEQTAWFEDLQRRVQNLPVEPQAMTGTSSS